MKNYSTQELILLILKYRKYENDIEGYSSKLINSESNKLINKIAKFEIQFSVKSPRKAFQYIVELIENNDILISSFIASWALNCKILTTKAIELKKIMMKNTANEMSALNAQMFLDIYTGKYGGWKRDERYPDLSEYEDKRMDK